MSETVWQVFTTTNSPTEADSIARTLVEQRLAACVNVTGPVQSTYRWQGRIETDEEWRCTMKTLKSQYAEVEATIRKLHSYDEPEIVATEIIAGSQSYLDWVRQQCQERE